MNFTNVRRAPGNASAVSGFANPADADVPEMPAVADARHSGQITAALTGTGGGELWVEASAEPCALPVTAGAVVCHSGNTC